MAGQKTVQLSQLSRGCGTVKRSGHSRIDVLLQPEDYYNCVENLGITYRARPLNVINGSEDATALLMSRDDVIPRKKAACDVNIPKTYLTRRGALLLFSEELAEKQQYHESRRRRSRDNKLPPIDETTVLDPTTELHTVDDLAWAVLTYGSRTIDADRVHLDFVKTGRTVRYFRPGFSAKRYLSRLTRSFDDRLQRKLIDSGWVNEKTLFTSNELVPRMRRRINDDLSYTPTPYRILKRMLLGPGLLSGLSFFTEAATQGETGCTQDTGSEYDTDDTIVQGRPVKVGVRHVKNGRWRKMSYKRLTVEEKEKALADLLVKSAISHAINAHKAAGGPASDGETLEDVRDEEVDGRLTQARLEEVGQLNMVDAIQSYLISQSLGMEGESAGLEYTTAQPGGCYSHYELPSDGSCHDVASSRGESVEADDERSESSVRSSTRKNVRGRVPARSRSGPATLVDTSRLYKPMTPITDIDSAAAMSREVSTFNQWNVLPAIDAAGEALPVTRGSDSQSGPGYASGSERQSITGSAITLQLPVMDSSKTGQQTSHGALRGAALRTTRPSASDKGDVQVTQVPAATGSVVVLPGGQVVRVGQTIGTTSQTSDSRTLLQTPSATGGTRTEVDAIDALSDRARQIAAIVLTQPGTGENLGHDAMLAASIWSQMTSSRQRGRSPVAVTDSAGGRTRESSSVGSRCQSDDQPDVDADTTAQSLLLSDGECKADDTSVSDYHELLRETLSSVVSGSTSADSAVPLEADVSSDLLKALVAEKDLNPEDLCLAVDAKTGRSVIDLKSELYHVSSDQSARDDVNASAVDSGMVSVAESRVSPQEKRTNRQKTVGLKSRKVTKDPGSTRKDETIASELQTADQLVDATRAEKVKVKEKITSKVKERDEFVVGRVPDDKELSMLYGNHNETIEAEPAVKKDKQATEPTNKDRTAKKKKPAEVTRKEPELKVEQKAQDQSQERQVEEKLREESQQEERLSTSDDVERQPEQSVSVTVRPTGEPQQVSVTVDSDDYSDEAASETRPSSAEMEFVIVRDEFPEEDDELLEKSKLPTSSQQQPPASQEQTQESTGARIQKSSRETREMRAAQREAKAIKRREEAERKRREREERLKAERGDAMRREELLQQLEVERMQREEELRLERERRKEEQRRKKKKVPTATLR